MLCVVPSHASPSALLASKHFVATPLQRRAAFRASCAISFCCSLSSVGSVPICSKRTLLEAESAPLFSDARCDSRSFRRCSSDAARATPRLIAAGGLRRLRNLFSRELKTMTLCNVYTWSGGNIRLPVYSTFAFASAALLAIIVISVMLSLVLITSLC